jgi:MFS family permease
VIASPLPPAQSRLPVGLRAFQHRNFRLFWVGQAISLIGTWMQTVAQSWLIFQLTHDPIALGLLAVVQFAPVLVLGLFGGVVADAFPKRNALVATQAASLVLALLLGLLDLSGAVQVWEVFVLAGLLGIVSAFDMPIRQSFVVEMVGREDIVNAVALNSALFNGTRIVGPAIAGLLITTVGIAACFLINAASYVAVIFGLFLMRARELRPPPVSALERTWRSVVGQLAEGLRYVRDTPSIRIAIIVLGLVSTAAINFGVVLPLLAQNVLGGGAETFGFLSSATGIGSLVGALVLAFGPPPTMRRALVGAAAIGLGMLGIAFSRSLIADLLLMALAGWGMISMGATINTMIQLTAPDHLRGRVMSVYTTVFVGSTPIGGLISGSIAAAIGTPAVFLVAGLVSLLTVGGAVLWLARGGGPRPVPAGEPSPDQAIAAARADRR